MGYEDQKFLWATKGQDHNNVKMTKMISDKNMCGYNNEVNPVIWFTFKRMLVIFILSDI